MEITREIDQFWSKNFSVLGLKCKCANMEWKYSPNKHWFSKQLSRTTVSQFPFKLSCKKKKRFTWCPRGGICSLFRDEKNTPLKFFAASIVSSMLPLLALPVCCFCCPLQTRTTIAAWSSFGTETLNWFVFSLFVRCHFLWSLEWRINANHSISANSFFFFAGGFKQRGKEFPAECSGISRNPAAALEWEVWMWVEWGTFNLHATQSQCSKFERSHLK